MKVNTASSEERVMRPFTTFVAALGLFGVVAACAPMRVDGDGYSGYGNYSGYQGWDGYRGWGGNDGEWRRHEWQEHEEREQHERREHQRHEDDRD
jgi:hypothetical protein